MNRPNRAKGTVDETAIYPREVVDAGKALGITRHDHLIIGGRRHASFNSLGLL